MNVSFKSYSNFIKVLGKQTLDDLAQPKAVLGRDIDITYELSVASRNGYLAQAVSNIQRLLKNEPPAERVKKYDNVAKEFKKVLEAVHAHAQLKLKG